MNDIQEKILQIVILVVIAAAYTALRLYGRAYVSSEDLVINVFIGVIIGFVVLAGFQAGFKQKKKSKTSKKH